LRRKFLYVGVAAALLLNIFLFTAKRQHPAKGYVLRVASDTCYCNPLYRIIHLHLSKDGSLTIGPEAVQANKIATLLAEIYAVRAEHILYLSADVDVPFQNIAKIIDLTQDLQFPSPVPDQSALKRVRPMSVEAKLVTKSSIDKNCPTGCSNWIKEPRLLPAP
jgi:biopolymer transport protein ExbD